jgi:hypothetical protein
MNDDFLDDDYYNDDKDNYKRTKDDITDSVKELKGNINSVLEKISTMPEQMVPYASILPDIPGMEIEIHDYDKDIELIKIESKDTLESLANLYLTDEMMKSKNVYKIIKDDSMALSKLSFSIECAQRALISCMRQLDAGINDPEMYQSVAMFQKEMRDTVKMAYDLQKKMKDFYRELKLELADLNVGEQTKQENEINYTTIGDPKMLNDIMNKFKGDPDFINKLLNGEISISQKD